MSLATIVHFAQSGFDSPAGSTMADEGEDSLTPQVIPDWIRNRRPEEVVLETDRHKWKIYETVAPQLPLPNVDRVGPDALAFYVPFHFYRDDWGIYIRDVGVKCLACILNGGPLEPGDWGEGCLEEAESILRDHELWHAATEVACTRAEMLARQSLYRQYFENELARLHEEALANAHAVRSQHASSPCRDQARSWMSRLGPGYRDFAQWTTASAFARGREMAVRFMTDCLPKPSPRASGEPLQFLYHGSVSFRSMPIRRIVDLTASDASVVRPFPKQHGLQVLVHSADHPPPHFHIVRTADNRQTRYSWPLLSPLEGNTRLSGRDAKAFEVYWATHEQSIIARLKAVYPHLAVRDQ